MPQLAKSEEIEKYLRFSSLTCPQISKKVAVSLTTVYNVKRRVKNGSSLRHNLGAGRLSTLRNSIKRNISAYIRHKLHLSLRCIASNLQPSVSHETVRSSLRDMNYSKPYPTRSPLLTENHKTMRVKWAKKFRYPKNQSAKTILVDEMSVWLSKGKIRMWTKKGQKRISPTTKHSPKINVWAAFCSMGVFPICIFKENMDSRLFIQIMEGYLLTQANVFFESNWRLAMDNDPKHTSRLIRDWIASNVPKRIPSQSPDLNPIENLFVG